MIAPGTTLKPLVRLPKDPNDCWTWLGAIDRGVAKKCVHGQMTTARRWIWTTLFGPIPDGIEITTSCGEQSCTNPHHLRACTHAEATREGTAATLLPADVADIRRAGKDRGPNTSRVLADRYGVTTQTIRAVWDGSRWSRRKRSPTRSPAQVATAPPPP